VYGVIRFVPALANYATAIAVIGVIIVAWFARSRAAEATATDAPTSVGH
jgi:hypothetical protein